MKSSYVKILCHRSDCWSQSSFYEIKWNLDTSHLAPVENIPRAYDDNTKKLPQHTSFTKKAPTTTTPLHLTPKPLLQHKFNQNYPHLHITCDDTAVGLVSYAVFLEKRYHFYHAGFVMRWMLWEDMRENGLYAWLVDFNTYCHPALPLQMFSFVSGSSWVVSQLGFDCVFLNS